MSQDPKNADFHSHTDMTDQSGASNGFAESASSAESSDVTATENNPEVAFIDHDQLASVQGELEKALAKAEENWNLYLGARAEADNIRKRGERDLQNAHKFALKDFVDALLPIKDSLEMGIMAAADETVDVNKLREGSELTLKMLMAALEKFGVQEIDPLGYRFNPELHEAMAMQPSATVEPNTVLQVIQKGYMLNERLIRPAMVIVAQAAQTHDPHKPDSEPVSDR
jgi:molecular chaperone GrpE